MFPQNTIEDSGAVEREVSLSEKPDSASDGGVMAEEEMESGESDDDVSHGPLTVTAAPVLSDSSTLALVWVDLADSSQQDAHAGVLALGFTHEQDVPSDMVGLESRYMNSMICSLVMELSVYDAEPQSPMVCKPLAIIEPLVQTVVVSGKSGGKFPRGGRRSKWVNQQYKEIRKLMGFPIDSHK